MTTAPRTNSRRMYSWWWDSHISPKNSKWLQENLTDMDVKVKQMIKLLESDADSFARRAEMYYKKRPELMKLVEEFYRAYRALAERYDNATGVLRQAHRTITEAFPNQVTFDDSPAGLSNEGDPQTPEMPSPIRALFDPDELQKDGLGLGLSPQSNAGCRNGAFTDESYTVTSRRGLKKFNDIFDSGEGRAKKGLNFHDFEENDRNGANNLKVSGTEAEISALKEALAKLEAEKEAGLLQYQQSLDKLSNLQSEVSRAQEDSERLNDRASKAETESHNLREALKKLESEQEASLLKYQQCLDKVSILESDIFDIQRGCEELTERASKAENEKEAALARYQLSLERIVKLEEKLHHAEESSRRYNELADKAESELIILKQAVEKLTDEKEAAAFQYLQRLEKISSLEYRLSCAEEEAERLHREIDDGVLKLRNVEEKCLLLETSNLALQSELETLVMKTGSQNQELTDNQKELGRLWSCIQDEHLRFVEAETAFQTLQDLHSQTEEELRSLAAELQKRTQFLKSLEIQNESLVAEVEEAKNENRKLDELNMSSALSIKNLQDELSSLREKLTKLEAEVEHRTNERNALQQEIYCLKEEINELNKKNEKLQDEKAALLEKLIILEKLVEKNAFLENSISDMSVDLEETKDRVNILEESCQSLLGDKSALSSEKVALTSLLQVTTKNLDELSEKNTHLENSLSDVVAELEALRVKSKDLEVSCQLLDQQKSGLVTERESLLYQLEDMDKRCRESVEKHSVLSNEKESVFCEMEKLKVYLDAEKQAHSSSTEISEKRLAGMESQMRLLQEECDQWRKEYEGETDKAIDSQFVIFILQNCMQDMKDNNLSLYLESQKLFEELGRSKEAISELELENLKKLEQIKSFIEKNKILRTGLQHVLRTFDIHAYREFDHEADLDQTLMEHIFCKLDEKQNSINEIYDEYYKLVIEKSVTEKFLVQLKNEAASVLMEMDALDQENKIQLEQISTLQSRILVLNEERKLKEQALETEMENVCRNLHNVQEAYQLLQVENSNALDAKASLTKEVFELGKRRRRLEEENNDMFNETIFQNQLFPICKDIIHEILEEMRKLAQCRDELQFRNDDLEERVKELERKLGYEKAMNLELAMFLEKSRSEAENYLTEKNTLDMEHRNQSERYSTLQVEMEKLLELNEEMRLKIVEGSRKEEAVTTEMENVCKKLQNLEGAYKILHDESCKANEERQELEEVNINMFTEIMFQTELSFIYEDAISENLAELRKLNECMDELHCRNNELEEGVKVMSEKLGDEQTKNVELVHSLEKARHEAENDLMERKMLDQELRNQSELNTKLMELNEEMRLKIVEGSRKEEALTTEMENVCKKLQNLEEAYEILHAENCKALEEEKSLTNEILSLKKEKRELEDANVGIFGETMFQSQLSFIYKDIVSENIQELRKLVECMDKLQSRNEDLEERVILLEGELGDELTKNSELTLFLAATECVVEQLETLLTLKQNEKSDLFRAMEELEEINEEQKKQMEKISSDKDCLAKETEFLREENRKIDLELKGLRNEVEKNIIREESLTTELQMKNNEIQSWESQAATFFGELQISCIHQLIFEDKIRELTEAYEILRDRNTSNDAEIEFMKEKIISSEGENGRMKGQLAAYALAIQTLKDSISSLEKHAITSTKKQKVDEQEVKESATTSQHSESFHLPHDDQVHHDDSIELQDLSRRIQAIEVAFEEFESQTTLEKFNANAKLEKAMKEIQEVKKSGQESGRLTKDRSRGHERYNRSHSKSEISEAENDVLTKDIVLDRISDHSTYRNSQRETAAAGDRMLQLWESTDQDRSYNRAAGKAPMVASSSSSEYQRVGSSRRRSSKQPSNESLGAVEKLEISKSLSAVPREGNKRRILERLDSDAQKLTNLQITVQDLKKKMDVTVKEQVEEAEEDINKLYEMNLKLTKSVHDIFLAADGASSTLGPEENESVQSRRISEQARRGSEKIGRLQLELKKLQFLIMKLDGERESRGRSKVSERSPRVLLRDYLYGGTRTKQKQKKKKAPCCACVRPPPTRSD